MEQVIEIISHPLVMPIVAPLLLGALAYAVSRWSAFLSKIFAVAAAAVVLAGGVYVLRIGGLRLPTQKLVELSGMISLDLAMASSPLGMIVLLGSAGFAILITIYSFRAMSGNRWEGKFYAYLTWTLAGCCVVALADNLLVLLVGWELVTLMLFLLLNLGRADAPAGAAKTYGVLGFADACLLMAVVLLMTGRDGSASLSLSGGAVNVAEMGALGYVVYVLILIAALAKAGAVPLHTWIPAAAKGAPAMVMALLPAALDKLLGIYLLAVLSLRMLRPDWTLQVIMMLIGAVTIIAAVMMAMIQHNLKKLLSFHAVSQVGYMVLGIGTGTVVGIIGGLFHMVNHAIYKSNLFLMSGTIRRAAGTDEIEEMGGLARYLPVTFICGLISAMAISGVPPFNGFASKWLVYQGTLGLSSRPLGTLLLVMAVFGSALTLASFVKVMHSAFLAPPPSAAALAASRPRESFFLAAPMVVLAAACVFFGLWPGLAVRMLSPAVAGTAEAVSTETATVSVGKVGLWNPTTATGLIIIGIVIGLIFVWISTWAAKVRVVRPFLAGEVPRGGDGPAAGFRIPGTHFYETISKLPVIGGLLKQGEGGAMDLYHWSARHGRTFVELLRRQHTGLISLYVTWVVMGIIATLIYLLLAVRT